VRPLRLVALAVLAIVALVVCAAPFFAPNRPTDQFADRTYAPPTRIHIRDANGFRAPFIYRQVLEDRLMKRYREDTTTAIPLRWFADGRLMSVPASEGPLLVLGADAVGRDVFSRLLSGARLSLGVTLVGVAGALALGALIGGLAGTLGGRVDTLLMLVADFILVLPGAYVVLVLRGSLPPVLPTLQIFLLTSVFFTIAAWPHVARGVRAIVAAERVRDYAEAARAAGAGPLRLFRQFLPAARGFLGVEIVLLVPALLLAEITVSYLGLGFTDAQPSWGTMLQDVGSVNVIADAPWMLAPAAGIFVIVLAINGARRHRPA
jgi:peptide/nickel transport system permease protein